MNVYEALRSGYEAYHAQMTGYIPEQLIGVDISELMDEEQDIEITGPAYATKSVKNGRYLGLYKTVHVNKEALAPNEHWISQDQVGRYEMVERVMHNMEMLLDSDEDTPVTIIDYAGGVGNSTAAMIEKISAMEEDTEDQKARKQKMIDNFRVVIRDYNDGQLEGGRIKFEELEKEHEWLKGKYVFVKSDVTEPMSEGQLNQVSEAFGTDTEKFDLNDSVLLGMTSYTAGALPGEVVEKMAEQIKNECYYFTAIDFSNPEFRKKQFLEQTGTYGQEYLETIHGQAEEESGFFRKAWVKANNLGAGLFKHYNLTWPGVWGHNSGYGVRDNGTLRLSSILELGQALDDEEAPESDRVRIKSAVNSFSYLYTGSGVDENGEEVVRLAVIPGWVRDDISVYQEDNRVPASKRNS
jgi:hypothetical protein